MVVLADYRKNDGARHSVPNSDHNTIVLLYSCIILPSNSNFPPRLPRRGSTADKDLTQLSQLGEKSQQYQRTHSESRHYATVAGARTVLPGAVMRGGGCGGRSSLSCRTSTFCSAVSSV